MSNSVDIVFEDEYIVVVDKPAGLLMHPSWLDKKETDTLAARVKSHFLAQGDTRKIHTVHRLDRPTSGLVIIAKTVDVARQLSEQFRNHTIQKTYWAVCRGFVTDSCTIDHPLCEELDKIGDRTASKERESQPALTRIRPIAVSEIAVPVSRYPKSRFSWLECSPSTGRKHQIRRHLKHIRHPILGDTRYGCRHSNKVATHELDCSGLALRAVALSFEHPMTSTALNINAPMNQEWSDRLSTFGWNSEHNV